MDKRKKLKQFNLLQLAETCDEGEEDSNPASEAPTEGVNAAANEVNEVAEMALNRI